ncbi:MAG: hypothetical protein COZ69_04645 [Deltaproteobacteria bacterium CG_4_8_14_3_um_filter_45_9]|nr:MAG: hypothetical protein COS40_00505 [Deltaproteobacteria bacterium CG03_land_8_20_14_0_80_45_14]PIX24983.1 MAG: hypothetical protein COZ69_04645 [Deltaproteobacteria bacterium CG_4_8_14_3_um_filter_45_9]
MEEILKDEKGYICTLSINRPRRRNALNAEALFLLGDTLNNLRDQENIRVVIIRGVGEEAFSAGVDLMGLNETGVAHTLKGLNHCLDSLIKCPLPIIAMIFGPAIGAGLDIAIISDFRIASETARFGANLVKLGRVYYYTAIERMLGLVGLGSTKELLLTGRLIDAQRAKEIGLVNEVMPREQLIPKTYSLARELAEGDAPLAIKGTKELIHKLFTLQKIDPEIEAELKAIVERVNQSEDAREGLSAIMEKRKPKFTGR